MNNPVPHYDSDLERFVWLARNRPRQTFNSTWRALALAAAAISVGVAISGCNKAHAADPFAAVPGAAAVSKIPGIGGIFGGGDEATKSMQLLQQAEALLQSKAQLEMLRGLDLNNAQQLAQAVYAAQDMLGKLDGVLSYNPGTIVGEVDERYPLESGPLSSDELLERARLARLHNRAALAESHRLQAQLSQAVAGSADRDAATLDTAAAAPGIRAAIMAGNQLAASTAAELRQMALVMAANGRAMETERLNAVAAQEEADAYRCYISEGKSPVCRK